MTEDPTTDKPNATPAHTAFGRPRNKAEARCLQWTLAYLLLVVMLIFAIYRIVNPPHGGGGWYSRAKGTLRLIGSDEFAYAEEYHSYGSFKALSDTEYIAKGYTLGNMIEHYSLEWRVNSLSTVAVEGNPLGIAGTFTVIAWPRETKPGILETCAITDDQVVRVYNPKSRNKLNDVHTWDPVL